jgi:cytochrome c oxidase cbb3-type subunit 4
MDSGTVSGIVTLVMFITFIGIAVWAWGPGRKRDFDEAANLPLRDRAENDAP